MKKTFEFSADDEKYMLKNTNPNEKKAEFVISKKEMQFDTNAFYNYVFSDIAVKMELEIVDKTSGDDKAAKRVYGIVSEIASEGINKMNEKCLSEIDA